MSGQPAQLRSIRVRSTRPSAARRTLDDLSPVHHHHAPAGRRGLLGKGRFGL